MRPLLVINPRSDEAFVELADRLVREGLARPEELEARLRDQYPHASVRERTLSGEPVVTWYVYREGRWTENLKP